MARWPTTRRRRSRRNERLEAPCNRGRTAMTVMTRTRFDVVPLSKHIGAEIRGLDLREKPDDETIRAIYQAWLDHLVIVFPGQTLSQEDLIRATGYFGELGELSRPPKYFPKGYSAPAPGVCFVPKYPKTGRPFGPPPPRGNNFPPAKKKRGVPN